MIHMKPRPKSLYMKSRPKIKQSTLFSFFPEFHLDQQCNYFWIYFIFFAIKYYLFVYLFVSLFCSEAEG